MRTPLLLLLATGLLPACLDHNAPPLPARISARTATDPTPIGTPPGARKLDTLTPAELRGLSVATKAMQDAMAQGAPDWRSADTALRTQFDAHASHPWAHGLRQSFATKLLTERLLPAPPSTARTEAVAFYARLLLWDHSPDALLISQALDVIGDAWSDAEIAAAREVTRQHAVAYASPVLTCVDVDCETVRLNQPERAEASQVMRYVASGLPVLREE